MAALLRALDAQLYKTLRLDFDLLKFLLRQRCVGFDVADAPFFDSDAATQWFTGELARCRRYLEYGSGGSTVAAAKLGVDFVTVESDPFFLKSVRRKIESKGWARADRQVFHYADIGITGHVGHPLYHWRASARRLERFRRYSDPPIACFDDGRLPDLVLVDGRFRVACALKALRMLRRTSGWKIVFDDYVNRPAYHAVNEFARLAGTIGQRIAVFDGPKDFEPAALDAAVRRYETVPD